MRAKVALLIVVSSLLAGCSLSSSDVVIYPADTSVTNRDADEGSIDVIMISFIATAPNPSPSACDGPWTTAQQVVDEMASQAGCFSGQIAYTTNDPASVAVDLGSLVTIDVAAEDMMTTLKNQANQVLAGQCLQSSVPITTGVQADAVSASSLARTCLETIGLCATTITFDADGMFETSNDTAMLPANNSCVANTLVGVAFPCLAGLTIAVSNEAACTIN